MLLTDRLKDKKKKISKLLVEVKAGVEHLYDKLAFYRLQSTEKTQIDESSLGNIVNHIKDKMEKIYSTGKRIFFGFRI